MSESIDEPPESVLKDIVDLQAALDKDLPPKIPDRNLLIATWNLKAFGSLTESWKTKKTDTPKRNWHALKYIAEIVSRFDVIAIQEVRENLRALRHLLKMLGENWSFIITDETKGPEGNDERLAFLFDTRKVTLSGLACELVLPEEDLNLKDPDAIKKQFARTPYAVSFKSADKTFILVTLHIIYATPKQRIPELKAIAKWLSKWAKEINQWGHNLITLGDFNIDRKDDELYKAFISKGLYVPQDLLNLPRTIFSPDAPNNITFYDQIAWFNKKTNVPALSLKYTRGGNFDFTKTTFKTLNLTKEDLQWRISDHYPLWTEFDVRQ